MLIVIKLLKAIAATILLLTVGSCAICFVAYKVFLDKPGFFRQFDNIHEVREHLLNDLVLYEENKTDTIDYMQQHLSHDEGCTPLLDAVTDDLHCLVTGCPSATDETPSTVMHCLVRSSDVFVNYRISLFFEYDKLNDMNVELRSGLP